MAKIQTAFKMEGAELEKAKYVAWYERTNLTAIIVGDLNKRVAKFEKEHGEITPADIQKMESKR